VGFAEYAGLPLASSAVLVGAGGLLAGEALSLPLIVVSAALGGFVADAVWFGLSRWRGDRVLQWACGLTLKPDACVVGVCGELEILKKPQVVLAKFLPGTANLLAPAAGLSGVSARLFLSRDAVALLFWATVYTSAGWVFADQVTLAVSWVARYFRYAAWTALGLVAAALLWRLVRIRVHRRHHGDPGAPGGEEAGEEAADASAGAGAGEPA